MARRGRLKCSVSSVSCLMSRSVLLSNSVCVNLSWVVSARKNAMESNDDHACTHRPQLLPAEDESTATTVHLTSQTARPNPSPTSSLKTSFTISSEISDVTVFIKMVHIAAASNATEHQANSPQTALFNFQSLLLVILLTICTSTYAHYVFPGIIDRNKDNYFVSPFWKAARVGERLSPYVSLACVVMAVSRGLFVEGAQGEARVKRRAGDRGDGAGCVEDVGEGCGRERMILDERHADTLQALTFMG